MRKSKLISYISLALTNNLNLATFIQKNNLNLGITRTKV